MADQRSLEEIRAHAAEHRKKVAAAVPDELDEAEVVESESVDVDSGEDDDSGLSAFDEVEELD